LLLRSERKHSYSNRHGSFVNEFGDNFEDNERRITCAKEKNVMNQKKNSCRTFLSEKLRQDVVVSLEEMGFILLTALARVALPDSTDSQSGFRDLLAGH
jgi:hypothetical protein